MKKRIIALALCLLTLLSAVPAFAAAPEIRKVEYDGKGIVEVDFRGRVQYKHPTVEVTDEDGVSYDAVIRDRDSDDLSFRVKNFQAGKKYEFVIDGIRLRRSGEYGQVGGTFAIPKPTDAPVIEEVEWDAEDNEIGIDFDKRVQYKKLKVRVKDESGKTYAVKIREKDRDSIEARVRGLRYGETYTVTVSGVRAYKAGTYGTVSKTFVALDD